MRKLVTSIALSCLAATGLVAGAAGTATAQDDPYPGCMDTSTELTGPGSIPRHTAPTVTAEVATDGNVDAEGFVTVYFKQVAGGPGGHGKGTGNPWIETVPYDGAPVDVTGPEFHSKKPAVVFAVFTSDGSFCVSGDATLITVDDGKPTWRW